MKALFLILIFFLYALFSQAATYYSIASGNWDDVNVWSSTDDIPISQLTSITGHVFYIENGNQINFNGITNPAEIHAVSGQLNSTGSLTGASIKVFIYSGGSINITGNFTTEYIYYRQEINANISISVGGDFTTASLFTHSHNPNFNISASNVTITNYNYHSTITTGQHNIINTTFDVSNPISVTNFYPSTQGSFICNNTVNITNYILKSDLAKDTEQNFNLPRVEITLIQNANNTKSVTFNMQRANEIYIANTDFRSTAFDRPFYVNGFAKVYLPNGIKTQNADNIISIEGDLYVGGEINVFGNAFGVKGRVYLTNNISVTCQNSGGVSGCIAIGSDFYSNDYDMSFGTLDAQFNIYGNANIKITTFPNFNTQTIFHVRKNLELKISEAKQLNGGKFLVGNNLDLINNFSLTFNNSAIWYYETKSGLGNIIDNTNAEGGYYSGNVETLYQACGNFTEEIITEGIPEFPLPITLQEFKGNLHPNGVELEWTTCSEKNNEYFTIWKSNTVSNFDEIVSVQGAGNSIEKNTYTYLDKSPYIGNNYYRLSQTDYDGTTEYFPIIAVHYLDNYKIGVSPTVVPRNGKIKIETDATNFTAKLLNINGIELIQKKSNQQSDIIQLNGNIAPGNYILHVQVGYLTITENIIVY